MANVKLFLPKRDANTEKFLRESSRVSSTSTTGSTSTPPKQRIEAPGRLLAQPSVAETSPASTSSGLAGGCELSRPCRLSALAAKTHC